MIAEKTLGVKYIELTCKSCKTVFHAELGDARMAPAAEHVVLPGETPFTALSQPFAKRLLEYGRGKQGREDTPGSRVVAEWSKRSRGCSAPSAATFAGQFAPRRADRTSPGREGRATSTRNT